MLHLLSFLLMIALVSPAPITTFINHRLLVRRNCQWSIRKTQNQSNLLCTFFEERRGECLYAISEVQSQLHLIVELKDADLGESREIIIQTQLTPRGNQTRFTVPYGKNVVISFKDPQSMDLYAMSQHFHSEMRGKETIITLSSSHDKLTLNMPKLITFQFSLDTNGSSYNEELVVIWLVFVFLNYQWFYFNKNEGVILREFKSIKKGWCFKVVSLFLINHTSFPLSLNNQFQRFAGYVQENKGEIVEMGLLLVLMAGILIFIGVEMGRLMKKVSHRSKQPLHIRQAVDYILIFSILVLPFEYVLILMPVSKFLQIWYLLTLEESHYIGYYEYFGKVVFDWVQGMYFTLYSKNFAEVEPNYTAAAFILSIFIIEVMIFLMELFSHHEFRQLRGSASTLYQLIATFFIRIESKRAEIDKCSICLQSFGSPTALQVVDEGKNEIFEATTIAVTRCDHKFHAACIEKWFRDGNTICPLDRQNLTRDKRIKSTKSK